MPAAIELGEVNQEDLEAFEMGVAEDVELYCKGHGFYRVGSFILNKTREDVARGSGAGRKARQGRMSSLYSTVCMPVSPDRDRRGDRKPVSLFLWLKSI